MRIRDLADEVGITERAVAHILSDLEAARVLTKHREGRRNVYHIDSDAPLRHPVEAHRTVGDLVRLAEPLHRVIVLPVNDKTLKRAH